MNGRKTKQIRKMAVGFLVQWLKTMLTDEEIKKVSAKTYKNYLPKETHVYTTNSVRVSAYTPKWFGKLIKKKLKSKPLDKITYSDII
jgi:hypothetical protein|tara:strand:- start:1144 stop:1404 length:261 start_codon:yes stop_codon:yes gene_type:complete